MKVTYIGDMKDITFRDVLFTKNIVVDLSENESLFQKVSVLDYFKVVNEMPEQTIKTPSVKKRTRKTKIEASK